MSYKRDGFKRAKQEQHVKSRQFANLLKIKHSQKFMHVFARRTLCKWVENNIQIIQFCKVNMCLGINFIFK